MSSDFNETPGAPRYRRTGGTSLNQLTKNPIFKLVAVVALVGGMGLAGMQFLGNKRNTDTTNLPTITASTATQVRSGTEVTPEYDAATREADQTRIDNARANGDTAVPTVIDSAVMNPTVDTTVTTQETTDPLREFEALVRSNTSGRGPAPYRRGPSGNAGAPLDDPNSVPQPIAPPAAPINPEAVQNLAGVYRAQMEMMMGQWQPQPMNIMSTGVTNNDLADNANSALGDSAEDDQGRVIVPAGSMYYGHMLMEANSDIPGPIMAQILTGPFAGARIIGSFQTFREHLLIRFQTIVFRNKEYNSDILAVNPDTSLAGVASEVDPRYLQRALIPAAAAFVKAYGDSISQPTSTVTVTGSDTTTTSTDENTSKDAMYAGIGEAADRIGSFVDEEAAATKRLVRVAIGTPIGLFFAHSVREKGGPISQSAPQSATAAAAN